MKKFVTIKNPNWKDKIRLFFHCLLTFHQKVTYSEKRSKETFFKVLELGCYQCDPACWAKRMSELL